MNRFRWPGVHALALLLLAAREVVDGPPHVVLQALDERATGRAAVALRHGSLRPTDAWAEPIADIEPVRGGRVRLRAGPAVSVIMPAMPPLTSNHAKQNAAIAWVMDKEREAGREPRDTRYRAEAPADIESGERIIEVKAFGKSARGEFLWLEPPQMREGQANPDRFYLYVVENVTQGDPELFTLKVFAGEQLRRLLARAKEKHYFEVPLPVAEYDSAPREL